MTDRVFLSYQDVDRAVLDEVARLMTDAGFGISGRDYTRDELFVVGSPVQQLQAATAAIVLVTAERRRQRGHRARHRAGDRTRQGHCGLAAGRRCSDAAAAIRSGSRGARRRAARGTWPICPGRSTPRYAARGSSRSRRAVGLAPAPRVSGRPARASSLIERHAAISAMAPTGSSVSFSPVTVASFNPNSIMSGTRREKKSSCGVQLPGRVGRRGRELCHVEGVVAELVGFCETDHVGVVGAVVLDLYELHVHATTRSRRRSPVRRTRPRGAARSEPRWCEADHGTARSANSPIPSRAAPPRPVVAAPRRGPPSDPWSRCARRGRRRWRRRPRSS